MDRDDDEVVARREVTLASGDVLRVLSIVDGVVVAEEGP